MVFDDWRGGSPRETNIAGWLKTKEMDELKMHTSFEPAGARADRVRIAAISGLATRQWHHLTRRVVISLIIVPALMAFIAAGSWWVWTLTYDALGRQAASLAVVALLGGTFAISREIARCL
jgi:hypothetical protein